MNEQQLYKLEKIPIIEQSVHCIGSIIGLFIRFLLFQYPVARCPIFDIRNQNILKMPKTFSFYEALPLRRTAVIVDVPARREV